MTDPEPRRKLEGRVAQLLNARELVINIGSRHGVARGMRFAVLAEKPMEIRDPETEEILDVVDREKVRVEASEVRERITICRTYKTRTIGGGALASALMTFEVQRMLEPPRTIVETLSVKDSQLPAPLDPEDSYVKINDRVVLVETPQSVTSGGFGKVKSGD
jgi:hypothetical protein